MKSWFARHRVLAGVAAMVVVIAAVAAYVVVVVVGERSPAAAQPVPTAFRFVDNGGQNLVTDIVEDGTRTPTNLRCLRVYTAGGTTVCLRMSVPGAFEAAVFDVNGKQVRTVAIPGTPSRARVSASGKIVSWTVFVTGDSYASPGGFSTRTGVLDLGTGQVVESLETFDTTIDGKRDKRQDANFWGVTVASDDRTFYATLASGSHTWLVKGDLTRREMTTVRPGAECPSLSPDGTSVAYKKRGGRLGGWQLYVLDLATNQERELPGSDGIDDQAAWLTPTTLGYAKVQTGGEPSLWLSPTDGGTPRLLLPGASSPSPLT